MRRYKQLLQGPGRRQCTVLGSPTTGLPAARLTAKNTLNRTMASQIPADAPKSTRKPSLTRSSTTATSRSSAIVLATRNYSLSDPGRIEEPSALSPFLRSLDFLHFPRLANRRIRASLTACRPASGLAEPVPTPSSRPATSTNPPAV